MIVVSDTSPIGYLVIIGEADLLVKLFGQITIPQTVAQELAHPDSPEAIRHWIANPPPWLDCRSNPTDPGNRPKGIQDGEWMAIHLAKTLEANLLIVDDFRGRRFALDQGLSITGLLGVLFLAHTRKLAELADVLRRLRNTNFHFSDEVLVQLARRFGVNPKELIV